MGKKGNLGKWFDRSPEYVASLKPKATAKKGAKKKAAASKKAGLKKGR